MTFLPSTSTEKEGARQQAERNPLGYQRWARAGGFEALTAKAAGQKFSDEEWKQICIKHDNYFSINERIKKCAILKFDSRFVFDRTT